MSDDAKWQAGPPAFGTAIAKLLSLHARMLKVEAARRLKAATETAKLLGDIRG